MNLQRKTRKRRHLKQRDAYLHGKQVHGYVIPIDKQTMMLANDIYQRDAYYRDNLRVQDFIAMFLREYISNYAAYLNRFDAGDYGHAVAHVVEATINDIPY